MSDGNLKWKDERIGNLKESLVFFSNKEKLNREKRFVFPAIMLLVAVLSSACTPKQSIKYSLDDKDVLTNSPFANTTLAIKPFKDKRKPLTTDCFTMKATSNVTIIDKDGKTWYYNCDDFYKTDSVTLEITKAATKHIDHSRLFKQVILSEVPPSDADYILTGKVSKFDGLKESNLGAVIVVQSFGLIGALGNLARKNDYEGTTDLDGLQLIRLKDNAVIWEGNISGHIKGRDTVDSYGWDSFKNANLSLKEAVTNLINTLNALTGDSIKAENKQTLLEIQNLSEENKTIHQ